MHICCFSCLVHFLPFFVVRTLTYLWRESPLTHLLPVSWRAIGLILRLWGWISDPGLLCPNSPPFLFSLSPLRDLGIGHELSKVNEHGSQDCSSIYWGKEALTFPWWWLNKYDENLNVGWPSELLLGEKKSEARPRERQAPEALVLVPQSPLAQMNTHRCQNDFGQYISFSFSLPFNSV